MTVVPIAKPIFVVSRRPSATSQFAICPLHFALKPRFYEVCAPSSGQSSISSHQSPIITYSFSTRLPPYGIGDGPGDGPLDGLGNRPPDRGGNRLGNRPLNRLRNRPGNRPGNRPLDRLGDGSGDGPGDRSLDGLEDGVGSPPGSRSCHCEESDDEATSSSSRRRCFAACAKSRCFALTPDRAQFPSFRTIENSLAVADGCTCPFG